MSGDRTLADDRQRSTRSYGLNDPASSVVEEWPPSKRDLYDAARKLFWERGFADVSIPEIAAGAGLTKGAFYHYFGAKEDILRVMYERSLDRLLQTVERQRGEAIGAAAALDLLIREMVLVADEYRVEVTLFWEHYRRLPAELAEPNRARRRQFYRAIADLVARGVQEGELDAAIDPQVFAMSVIGVCQHSQRWFVPGRGLALEDMAVAVARTFLLGATVRPN